MSDLTHDEWIEDVEDLFERQPDPMPEKAALAIHGYIIGLLYAGAIKMEDYEQFMQRIPLDGEELADAGVNL